MTSDIGSFIGFIVVAVIIIGIFAFTVYRVMKRKGCECASKKTGNSACAYYNGCTKKDDGYSTCDACKKNY